MTPQMLAEVEEALRGLFDGTVAVAAVDARAPHPPLWPGEVLPDAVLARQREFAAGRQAARRAMAALGHAPQSVPMSDDRAPIWPEGLNGSISHAGDLCLAVVGGVETALGLDIEKLKPISEDIIATICSEMEIEDVTGIAPDLRSLLIFCAKEATYKAQYPLTQTLFDFETLRVSARTAPNCFIATFQDPIGRFAAGDSLPGRWVQVAGHLVTGVTIRLNEAERKIR